MKTETQRVTISAVSAKERYQRIRELLSRGYMIENNGLHEQRFTSKQYKSNRNSRGSKTFFDTDSETTRYIAVMSRVVPCKS